MIEIFLNLVFSYETDYKSVQFLISKSNLELSYK